ncbi:hypothetical protein BDZ89DRAFT_569190 [Hymenopellis radicata]|nr:hypothetical protein BDZ89DRAFT_569190 [Hymenopellis radicata]
MPSTSPAPDTRKVWSKTSRQLLRRCSIDLRSSKTRSSLVLINQYHLRYMSSQNARVYGRARLRPMQYPCPADQIACWCARKAHLSRPTRRSCRIVARPYAQPKIILDDAQHCQPAACLKARRRARRQARERLRPDTPYRQHPTIYIASTFALVLLGVDEISTDKVTAHITDCEDCPLRRAVHNARGHVFVAAWNTPGTSCSS